MRINRFVSSCLNVEIADKLNTIAYKQRKSISAVIKDAIEYYLSSIKRDEMVEEALNITLFEDK